MGIPEVLDFIRQEHGEYRDFALDELSILNAYADIIRQDIMSAWPVDTSTSRDNFVTTLENGPAFTGIILENDLDYVQFVHYAGTPAEPPLYQTLIPSVWYAYKPELEAALFEAIRRTEKVIRENEAHGGRGFLDIVARKLGKTPRVVSHAA
jgi:hypothetical protein